MLYKINLKRFHLNSALTPPSQPLTLSIRNAKYPKNLIELFLE